MLARRQFIGLDHVLLEDQDRLRHIADFVLLITSRNLNSLVAMGQGRHGTRDGADRAGNARADQPCGRDPQNQGHTGGTDHGDQPLAHGRTGVRPQQVLIRLEAQLQFVHLGGHVRADGIQLRFDRRIAGFHMLIDVLQGGDERLVLGRQLIRHLEPVFFQEVGDHDGLVCLHRGRFLDRVIEGFLIVGNKECGRVQKHQQKIALHRRRVIGTRNVDRVLGLFLDARDKRPHFPAEHIDPVLHQIVNACLTGRHLIKRGDIVGKIAPDLLGQGVFLRFLDHLGQLVIQLDGQLSPIFYGFQGLFGRAFQELADFQLGFQKTGLNPGRLVGLGGDASVTREIGVAVFQVHPTGHAGHHKKRQDHTEAERNFRQNSDVV